MIANFEAMFYLANSTNGNFEEKSDAKPYVFLSNLPLSHGSVRLPL